MNSDFSGDTWAEVLGHTQRTAVRRTERAPMPASVPAWKGGMLEILSAWTAREMSDAG